MLELVMGPHPIFKQKAEPIAEVNDDIRQWVREMFDIMYDEGGLGIAANMVGLLKCIIVVDLQQGGVKAPLAMINPKIVTASKEMHTTEEASLSFPGISAHITRPNAITVRYLDEQGQQQNLDAEGFLAVVIQHEMDYLDGKTYLDHLSKMKRDMLIRKMKKHSCGPGCGHHHH